MNVPHLPEGERPPRIPWWRRRRTALLGAFVLVALVVGVVQAATALRAAGRAEAAALVRQAETAQALASATELLVSRYLTLAGAAAHAAFETSLPDAERRRLLASLRAADPAVAVLAAIDRRGMVIGADPAGAIPADVSDRPFVRQALGGAPAVVTDLVPGWTAGAFDVGFMASSRHTDGSLRGLVVVVVRAAALGRELALHLDGRAYPLLVDRTGRVVVHGSRPDLDWEQRDFSGVPLVAEALGRRQVRSSRFQSPEIGLQRLGTMVPIPSLGWAVGVLQPVETALAPARYELALGLAAAASILALAVGLALALSHWFSRPVVALTDGVAAFARGDLGYRIEVRWRNEFGILALHLNRMAAQLEAASREQRALTTRLGATNTTLRRRVAELQTLLDVIPIGIALAHDPACRHVTGNRALAEMLGVPREANISKSAPAGVALPFRLYQDGRELSPKELPMQYAAARGVAVGNVELDVVRPDGTTLKLLEWAAPLFDEEGRVRGCFLAVVDITERTRIEEARRVLVEVGSALAAPLDDESTLGTVARLALSGLADWCAIDLLDADRGPRTIALVHGDEAQAPLARALRERYPPEPGRPHPVSRVLDAGLPELVPEVTDDWLRSRARDAEHLRLLREMRMTSAMLVPLTARGRLVGALSLAAAGSRRRYGPADLALAEELARRVAVALDSARLYREAREAARAREAFLARASHELRTPLTAALGTVRLLRRVAAGRLGQPPHELVEIANRNLDAMLALVNDLLDASKLAAGQEPLAAEPVRLEEIVERSLELVDAQARDRGVRLRTAIPGGLVVPADRGKIERVVTNLLANAIRFTPAGGEVAVLAEGPRGLGPPGVVVRVRDTGEGIPREDLERIFEPFFQVRTPGVRGGRGTGLGLAICRQIVALHGGEIWAESEGRGRGSTLVVRLPASAPGARVA